MKNLKRTISVICLLSLIAASFCFGSGNAEESVVSLEITSITYTHSGDDYSFVINSTGGHGAVQYWLYLTKNGGVAYSSGEWSLQNTYAFKSGETGFTAIAYAQDSAGNRARLTQAVDSIRQRYLSFDEIPVTAVGGYYQLSGIPGAVTELWELDGEFYFAMNTRFVGLNPEEAAILYYSLFKYNTDGSCERISDEVGYIVCLNEGTLVYDRSERYLTALDRWNVDYYTNSKEWNNEQCIESEEAKELITEHSYVNVTPSPEVAAALQRVSGGVSSWAANDEYVLCLVSGANPWDASRLELIAIHQA
ncbi:MAG: hypothetical protein LBS74_04420 [Oscillospiraceae bacterium]|jgi:hypothetical protein|nr:hypothetical protein [Oscillospiraceae bacterium]